MSNRDQDRYFVKFLNLFCVTIIFFLFHGCGNRSGDSNTDKTPPAAITDLIIKALTESSITIQWTAPGDNGNTGTAASYDIRYSTVPLDDTNWVNSVIVMGNPAPLSGGGAQEFTVTGLNCGTTYYFAIKTSDAVPNTSPISNIATGKTSDCPAPNSPVNTTDNDFINNGAIYTNSPVVNLLISARDDDGVTGYYASESSSIPPASAGGWTAISKTDSYTGTVSFTLSSSNGSKDIYVWFKDAEGNLSASRSDSIVLDNVPPVISMPSLNATLRATVIISPSVSDSLSGINRVEYFSGDVKLGESVSSPYSFEWDTTGRPDGSHFLVAKAYDNAGNSAASDSVTVAVDNTPPASPSGLTIVVINANRIDLAWTAPADSGISTYNIYRNGILIGSSAVTSFSDTGVLTGTSYAYSVSAVDAAGNESGTSSPVNGTANLSVAITSPMNLITVSSSPITVSGTVNKPTATVTVNGVAATVLRTQFEVQGIVISEGMNTIVARALDNDNHVATASINISLDSTPPHIAITSPPDGYISAAPSITVTGMINDIVRGTVNEDQGSVIVNGIDASASISNRNFIAEAVPLTPGLNTITASGADRWGNTASASINVTYDNTPRKKVTIVEGNNQSGLVGSVLSGPLAVSVTDKNDSPVAGATVVFRITENNGNLAAGVSTGRAVSVVTDASGIAQAALTLGTWAGAGNNKVDVSAAGVEGKVTFTESGRTRPPASIYVAQGSQQRGAIGQPLPEPLVAFVTDEGHNPLDNVPVIFKAIQGGGSFANGLDTITVNTDSDGRATVAFTLGATAGNDSYAVNATFEGNTGSTATFTATGLIPGDPGDTKISGVVLDNSNNPILNVTMRVEGTTREARTNANGQFVITNVPVGPVHLIADGNTAGSSGVLEYPTLMYELTTISGADNKVGMPIYLVPIDLTNAKLVGGNEDVTYTIPSVPGFELTIRANSVTFPDGKKQGKISVTQVHADKVPMVPQIGQQPQFIVTIQPPGTVFDPPAPITIPNVDGLAPGEKTNMYSFDHDLGIFVSIGTGTVSEDGMLIKSDPGVGVVKAGWHCGGNPTPTGSVNRCPECAPCNSNTQVCTPLPIGARCHDDGNVCTEDKCGLCQAGNCPGGGCTHPPKPDGSAIPGDECKECQGGNAVNMPPGVVTGATAKVNGNDEEIVGIDQQVHFTGTATGTDCQFEYDWDFGDGGTSAFQNPNYTYANPGEYTVSLKVKCKCGPSQKTDTVKVKVVKLDLIIHKPKVIDPGEAEIPEGEELTKGSQTFVNLDNDDQDGLFDTGMTDNSVIGEDELVKIKVKLTPKNLTEGIVKVDASAGGGSIKVWKKDNKDTEYPLGSDLNVPGDFTEEGNSLVATLYVEGIAPHTNQQEAKLKMTYDKVAGSDDEVALTVIGIDSLVWEGKNNSGNDDNTLWNDPNYPIGLNPGALRVFPDARMVGGALEGSPRDKVNIKVTLTAAPVEPVKIFFKSFDVDDPISDVAPVDNEADSEDNRGTVPKKSGMLTGEAGGVLEKTFTGRTDTIEFQTTLQPGDNFRVVGNGDRDFLLDLANDDAALGAADEDKQRIVNTHIMMFPVDQEIREAAHYATHVLTVWRFLHVESDSMGIVSGNEVNGNIIGMDPPTNSTATRVNVDNILDDGSADLDDFSPENGRFERGTLTVGGTVMIHPVDGNGNSSITKTTGLDIASTPLSFIAEDNDLVGASTITGTVGGIYQSGGRWILSQLNILSHSENPIDWPDFAGGTISIAGGPNMSIVNTFPLSVGTPIEVATLQIPYSLKDDDAISGDVPDPDTSGIATIYDDAYILPLFDTGMDNGDVPFDLNTDFTSEIGPHIRSGKGTPPSTNRYWVVTILNAYQTEQFDPIGREGENDPDSEGTWRGAADSNEHGVVMCTESLRDWIATPLPLGGSGVDPAGVGRQTRYQEIINHEVGHLFGLEHADGDVTAAEPNGGVMAPSCCPPDSPVNGTRGASTFTGTSLDKIRKRNHPGY